MSGGFAPYKTVRVLGEVDPLISQVDVIYESAGRILVAGPSGRVQVYRSNGLLIGTLVSPPVQRLRRVGGSLYAVVRSTPGFNEVQRRDGLSFAVTGTWTLNGTLADNPVVGEYLVLTHWRRGSPAQPASTAVSWL